MATFLVRGEARPQSGRRLLDRLAAAGLLVTLATVAWACGGSASTGTGDGSAPQAAESSTDVAAQPGEMPNPVANAVTIADAGYTRGSAHVEVSGGRQLVIDGQLLAGMSMTTEGTTLLMYPAGDGSSGVLFTVSNGADTGLAFTVTGPDVTTGGDGTNGCAIELTKNDASGLAGQFDCRGLDAIALDAPKVDVRGTFTAEP